MSGADIQYSSIKDELLKHGTYASLSSGTSMEPLFRTHRDVVVITVPSRPLKKYDVVLYEVSDGSFFLHRIIKVTKDAYLIRGDNTFVLERVAKDAVIGVLSSYTRKGKKHSVEDLGYKLYSGFWTFIYPLRLLKRKTRSLLSKIYRKLFRGKRK